MIFAGLQTQNWTLVLVGCLAAAALALTADALLGLIEGAEVQYENAAIGGDPMEISVYGTAISVRRQQADHFRISPITPNV